MDILRDDARAKVNLTLRVLGRRPDGYHELSSLAAFAGVCDRLELTPGEDFSLKITGPFAPALASHDNLVEKAASLFLRECPQARTGAFTLDKQLPVAAGLGGGSADAAAALRLLARSNPEAADREKLVELAACLGSDVSVCLESRAALMRGRGDEVMAIEGLPVLPAVLVNPGVELAAGEVYQALDAQQLDQEAPPGSGGPASFATAGNVTQYISSTGNDLQAPAMRLAPVIGDVLTALEETERCLSAQMSGSGATCFAIYADRNVAGAAAAALGNRHPDWWVCETDLS